MEPNDVCLFNKIIIIVIIIIIITTTIIIIIIIIIIIRLSFSSSCSSQFNYSKAASTGHKKFEI